MNPKWFGDSYDIVKRFFVDNLRIMGYEVFINPMFTSEWNGNEEHFYKLIGAAPFQEDKPTRSKAALLVDPDTGVGKESPKHIAIQKLIEYLQTYEIVIAFDQSFSRNVNADEVMQNKLAILKKNGVHGFYYDSHARFLFSARMPAHLDRIQEHLYKIGLPKERIVKLVS